MKAHYKFDRVDYFAEKGMKGESYDWDNFDQLTYDAWIVGRRLGGYPPIKEGSTVKQDGAAPKVSLHPANWR